MTNILWGFSPLCLILPVFLLPPFHGGGRREITHRPKRYSFDTGFVTFVKGWDSIREDDRGLLWEHLVLDILRTVIDERSLFYWRDKSGRELDFVVKGKRELADTIECKVNPASFDSQALSAFRSVYPEGRNYVVNPNIKSPYQRHQQGLLIHYMPSDHLLRIFDNPGSPQNSIKK